MKNKIIENNFDSLLILVFGVVISIKFILMGLIPVTTDEAYYLQWGKFPDFGYFDHPPMIAWLTSFFSESKNIFFARIPGGILSSLLFYFHYSFCRKIGFPKNLNLLLAVTILNFSFLGMIFGFLLTPDLPLILFWCLGLHELYAAFKESKLRWISFGIIVGLGFLSKYTIVLIFPIVLFCLFADPTILKRKYIYLGGLAFLITISPHLYWNSKNNWISIVFQLNHGLKDKNTLEQFSLNTDLPFPRKTADYNFSREKLIEKYFSSKDKKKKKKTKKTKNILERFGTKFFDYLGILLAPWGFFSFIILFSLVRSKWKTEFLQELKKEKDKIGFLLAASLTPIIFFGITSINAKVEANWPAMYMISATPLLISFLSLGWKKIVWAALLNGVTLIIIAVHAYSPLFKNAPNKDRILRETYGYDKLSLYLKNIEEPIFTDTYQNTSMLSFYLKNKNISQWPGITRYSEFLRRPQFNNYRKQDVIDKKSFFILSDNRKPPTLDNFYTEHTFEIKDCLGQETLEMNISFAIGGYNPTCKNNVHKWYLTKYIYAPRSF